MSGLLKLGSPSGEHTGWMFWCPGCRCAHSFDIRRWTFNGDESRPTFSPSLLVNKDRLHGSRRCHLFLRAGKIRYLADCDHHLAGQTVDLEPWEDQ